VPDEESEPVSAQQSQPEAEPAPESQPGAKSHPESQPEAEPAPEGPTASRGGRRVLSPVVRRLMAENNLDPDDITGTGYDRRITRDDVLAHLDRGAAKAGPRQAAAVAARREPAPARQPAAPASPAAKSRDEDEVIPFSNIRRRTAEHMMRSQATSAHVLTATEVDFANVDKARRPARARWKEEEGFSLTYLPFVSRAVIDAIRDFPHVNASVEDNNLVVHRAVHLGIAVDINFEGLIVPVIHDADSKRLRSIARETADLANRARTKKLTADEIAGSTFTITNPGGYGTLITAPVINQPQVAIVSTDGVKKRPVVVELPDGSDGIAIHPVGVVAMTFDHRAFDGAYASAFVARVRDILETRDWSQEL
jgi:2-oxoglutarate dehydrogenase E2 component (dihydrolipoamide succinyltransferase)